jgi:signal transduction histidine kinase
VACDLRREQDDLVLVVRDQGIGIPVREQAAVFDVFYRASNIGEVPGTGIGLSIVRDCVAALGGSISLQSAEGQGTTVTVCLPAFA